MTAIRKNLETIRAMISEAALSCGRSPGDIRLVAVTKKNPPEAVLAAIAAGTADIGENYVQEAAGKIDQIGREKACWHFIGHLQTNKARIAVRYFDYIHTVDSVRLAREINRQAASIPKIQKVLIQINIADEQTKSGADPEEALDLIRQVSLMDSLSVEGLMCMPPYFEDPEMARPYFRRLSAIGRAAAERRHDRVNMTHLSMGMSNDYRVAIEEGATLIRIGSAIFGERR